MSGSTGGRKRIGDCTWCGDPAYELLIVSKSNAKKTRSVPACDDHVSKFRSDGLETESARFHRIHGAGRDR